MTYAYDFKNRLISSTVSGVNTQFGYNGDGICLRLLEAGTLTTYTQDYAAPLPVVLQAKTGTNSTQYAYSLGTRPVSEYEAAAWEYLLPDPLGSVRQLADPSGNVTLLKSYEPYGSVLNSQGSATSVFGYSGEQVDATGLVYLRARYMQPRLGLFLSRDAWPGDVMRPGSMNGWNYVEGNSVNKIDPSGKTTASAAMSQLGLTNPQHGTTQFGVIADSVPLEVLGQLAGLICTEPSATQPSDSWVYAEGAAGVLTAGFGKYGAWIGVETVYNLSTMRRVTFDVRGIVLDRFSILAVGQADYFAFATGPGLPDYGPGRENESDLARDCRGHFENHCGSYSLTDALSIAGWGVCAFHSTNNNIRGVSTGVFIPAQEIGVAAGVLTPLPGALSYADLDYNYLGGINSRYTSIAEMRRDIMTGAESPVFPKDEGDVIPVFAQAREVAASLLELIQWKRGNLPAFEQ